MVLTVTLNPLFEKRFFFKSLEGNNNRADREEFTAGGKGLNINRQLNVLGIKNHALIFLGGANGKKLRHILEKENISFSVVSSKSETREATLIFDESKKKLTTYFGINPEISRTETDHFINKLKKVIGTCSTVVFSGSSPNIESSRIIKEGIELCNKSDKISILDSYGKNYSELIDMQPVILHNNIDELEKSLNISLTTEKEKIDLLKTLYKKNIKLAFLTNRNRPTYAAKSDFFYKIYNPEVQEKDSTGSGDAFVSGIIYGLDKALIFNDFTKLAAALGAINASSWEVCKVELKEAMEITDKIKIKELGKKMKIINDAPTIY